MRGERRAIRAGAWLTIGALLTIFSAGTGGCGLLKSKEDQKKAFGEACVKGPDCESGECATFGSVCTKGCTYDKDCGDGLVCRVRDVGTGSECSKPYGIAPGPTATCNAASECQHAQCLRKVGEPNAPGLCSKTCADATECPSGMKICDSISDSGAVKLCLPGDEKTPAAEQPKFTVPKPKPTATLDGGVPTDAGSTPVDAGSTPVDAGSTPRDAGSTPVDAGSTPVDAGSTPTDAGATTDGGRRKITFKGLPTK